MGTPIAGNEKHRPSPVFEGGRHWLDTIAAKIGVEHREIAPAFVQFGKRTKTPKRSSRRFTPAVAPLIANTKVPTRSSTSSSVSGPGSAIITSQLSYGASYAPRRDNQGLDTGFQGWIDHRAKLGAMVDRALIDLQSGITPSIPPGLHGGEVWLTRGQEPASAGPRSPRGMHRPPRPLSGDCAQR